MTAPPRVQFFGEPYPSRERAAPLYEGAEEIPAPVGELCYDCEEPIAEGDSGLMRTCLIRRNENDELYGTREPIHQECSVRQVVGSVKHQRGECRCIVADAEDDDAEYPTRREAARAAVAEFEKTHGFDRLPPERTAHEYDAEDERIDKIGGWETREDKRMEPLDSVVERGIGEATETLTPDPVPYLTACIIEDMANTLEAVARNEAGAVAARRVLERVKNPKGYE